MGTASSVFIGVAYISQWPQKQKHSRARGNVMSNSLLHFMKMEAPLSMLFFLLKKKPTNKKQLNKQKTKPNKQTYKKHCSFQKYPFFLVLNISGSIFLSLQKVNLSLSYNTSFWKECMYLP